MRVINLEIKARCAVPEQVRARLRQRKARFAGLDHQVDTYFRVEQGRLKLREGNIENALIHYRRPNESGPKTSDVLLRPSSPGLKEILVAALGVSVAVEKQREIYYLNNVKVHIDEVNGLGSFVEIEAAGDEHADRGALERQCRELMMEFGIREEDLVGESYSDLLLKVASGRWSVADTSKTDH